MLKLLSVRNFYRLSVDDAFIMLNFYQYGDGYETFISAQAGGGLFKGPARIGTMVVLMEPVHHGGECVFQVAQVHDHVIEVLQVALE